MTDHPIPADPCGVTEPGGETDQGIVTGLGKLARGVGVADFDGDGVPVALVGGGGLLLQGDALDHLPVHPHQEAGAYLGVRLGDVVPVGLGGGAGVAHVVDGDVCDLLHGLSPAGGAVDGDDLDIHPVGKGDGLQVAHLTRAQMGKAHGDDQSGGKQKKEGPAPLAAATAAGGGPCDLCFHGGNLLGYLSCLC